MSCKHKNCLHYHFIEMMKGAFSYQGEIPCLNCSEYGTKENKFDPVYSDYDYKVAEPNPKADNWRG